MSKARVSVFLVGMLLAAPIPPGSAQSPGVQPRMGDPVQGLSGTELARFFAGKSEGFEFQFPIAAGLGPIFNDVNCSGCHNQPASGGAGSKSVTRFGIAATMTTPFDPLDGTGPSGLSLGGSLQQSESIGAGCEEVVPVEADFTIQRRTSSVFGAGLVESIDDADILIREANPPAAWISGRVHWVQPPEGPAGLRAGRFGWKAQEATAMGFSSGASLNEQGITNDFAMVENAPNGNAAALAACDTVAEPEDVPDGFGFRRIDRMTDFQRFTAPPPQTPKSGMSGEALFVSVGCADCHVASAYTTNAVAEAALSNKQIKPYSDFLLHDIGTGDGVVQGGATGEEFRTVPLWGLRPRIGGGMLHDGRGFDNNNPSDDNHLLLTIDMHENEAAPSRVAFQALAGADRQRVLQFLKSLGQLEFDYEGDHDVDSLDWFFLDFDGLFSGPGAFYDADDPAAVADLDQDGDFDLVDFGWMQRATTN